MEHTNIKTYKRRIQKSCVGAIGLDILLLHTDVDGDHRYKLLNLLCTIDDTKFYFTNRIVNVWNRLPNSVVSSPTVAV